MKTFEQLAENDIVFIIDINPSIYTISPRKGVFKGWNSLKRYFNIIDDKGEKLMLFLTEDRSCVHRISNDLLTDVYYFSDIESLELFLKKLTLRVTSFLDGIERTIKNSWGFIESNEKELIDFI